MRRFLACSIVAASLAGCQFLLDLKSPAQSNSDGGGDQDAGVGDAATSDASDAALGSFGSVVTLAKNQNVSGMGVDASNVYWLGGNQRGVYRLPKSSRADDVPMDASDGGLSYLAWDITQIELAPGLAVHGAVAVIARNPACNQVIHRPLGQGSEFEYENYGSTCDAVDRIAVDGVGVATLRDGKLYVQPRDKWGPVARLQVDVQSGAMTLSPDHVFVASSTVRSYSRTSGEESVVATGQNAPPGIAYDSAQQRLYWVNSDGSVMTAPAAPPPLDGGPVVPTQLAKEGQALFMTTSRDWVIWASPDETIRAVAKRGGPVVVIATGQGSVSGLAADEEGAYWGTSDGYVRMAPLEGDASQ